MNPVALPRSREERLTVDGRDYRIFVAWPADPAPPSGYPLIVVLDANAAFSTVVEAVRMRSHRPDATGVGPAMVVGVGYPGDGPYMRDRRTFDFTRLAAAAVADGGDGRPAPEVGGAPRFLQMLSEDVTAIAGRDHAIDDARRTLFGHSMAGFFVLDTLVSAPGAFSSHVAMSPSIWWDRERLLAAAANRAADSTHRIQVRITVGEYEQGLAPWQVGRPPVGTVAERRDERRMVDHAHELADVLSRGPDACVECDVLDTEDHASVVPRSISEGLRFAFTPDRRRRLET